MVLLSLFGFRLEGSVWHSDDLPVEYCVGTCPEGIDDCHDRVQNAFAEWEQFEPRFRSAYTGPCADDRSTEDGVNQFTFDDDGGGTLVTEAGTPCDRRLEFDVALGTNTRWTTHEDVVDGNCGGGTNIDAVLTHHVGHLLGLGHSCEQDEVCLDPLLASATMFWSDGPCSIDQATLNEDDMAGLEAVADCADESMVCASTADEDDPEGCGCQTTSTLATVAWWLAAIVALSRRSTVAARRPAGAPLPCRRRLRRPSA